MVDEIITIDETVERVEIGHTVSLDNSVPRTFFQMRECLYRDRGDGEGVAYVLGEIGGNRGLASGYDDEDGRVLMFDLTLSFGPFFFLEEVVSESLHLFPTAASGDEGKHRAVGGFLMSDPEQTFFFPSVDHDRRNVFGVDSLSQGEESARCFGSDVSIDACSKISEEIGQGDWIEEGGE